MRGGSDHFDPQLLTHTFRLQDGLASPDQGPLGMAGANDRARDGEGDASLRRRYVHSGLGFSPSRAVNAQALGSRNSELVQLRQGRRLSAVDFGQ